MSARALVLGVVLLSACGSSAANKRKFDDPNDYTKAFAELEKNDKETKATAPDPNAKERPKGPIFPAPFTAEQIRDATQNGRTYRFKVEAPNEPTRERTVTFRNVDEGGAEIHLGERSRRMSWLNLQRDAEFPQEKVQTRSEKLKTPAGKFECIVYVVNGDDDEVWTYYFAKKLPGAPVFYYVERNGHRLQTTTLIEHIAGK